MIQFEGVSSLLPTPFNTDSQVDVQSLRRVIALYIRAGINGLTAMGVYDT
jgi:dihydrodipicolinate synthase/N-acetylneuraminate lyase